MVPICPDRNRRLPTCTAGVNGLVGRPYGVIQVTPFSVMRVPCESGDGAGDVAGVLLAQAITTVASKASRSICMIWLAVCSGGAVPGDCAGERKVATACGLEDRIKTPSLRARGPEPEHLFGFLFHPLSRVDEREVFVPAPEVEQVPVVRARGVRGLARDIGHYGIVEV